MITAVSRIRSGHDRRAFFLPRLRRRLGAAAESGESAVGGRRGSGGAVGRIGGRARRRANRRRRSGESSAPSGESAVESAASSLGESTSGLPSGESGATSATLSGESAAASASTSSGESAVPTSSGESAAGRRVSRPCPPCVGRGRPCPPRRASRPCPPRRGVGCVPTRVVRSAGVGRDHLVGRVGRASANESAPAALSDESSSRKDGSGSRSCASAGEKAAGSHFATAASDSALAAAPPGPPSALGSTCPSSSWAPADSSPTIAAAGPASRSASTESPSRTASTESPSLSASAEPPSTGAPDDPSSGTEPAVSSEGAAPSGSPPEFERPAAPESRPRRRGALCAPPRRRDRRVMAGNATNHADHPGCTHDGPGRSDVCGVSRPIYLFGQFGAARVGDLSIRQHVYDVGSEDVQEAPEMGDGQNPEAPLLGCLLHPPGNGGQSVDVQPRVDLVEYGKPRPEHAQLKSLVPLALAPREVHVERSVQEALVEADPGRLVTKARFDISRPSRSPRWPGQPPEMWPATPQGLRSGAACR